MSGTTRASRGGADGVRAQGGMHAMRLTASRAATSTSSRKPSGITARAHQRHVRPLEHLDEGGGARVQAQAGNAGGESHHAARQGTGKQGLEFEAAEARSRCSSARRSNIATRCFTWTPITFPCAATPGNPSVKRRSRSASAPGTRKRWPRATARERARRRVALGAGEILSAT